MAEITRIENNIDKQHTFTVQLQRYKKAIANEFYFEAILIDYAMLEDRLKSLLCYLGVVDKFTDTKCISKNRKAIRSAYFGSLELAKDKKLDLDSINVKICLVKKLLKEAETNDAYISLVRNECSRVLDIEALIEVLDQIIPWTKSRNGVIHALFNKNAESVDAVLSKLAEDGMTFARYIDGKAVSPLKKKGKIRETLRLGPPIDVVKQV